MGELRRISLFDAETQRTAEPQRTSLRAMYLTRHFDFPANHVELVQQLLVVAELELQQKLCLMTRMTSTAEIRHGEQPSPWFSAALRALCASASIITPCVQNHPLKHAKTPKRESPAIKAAQAGINRSLSGSLRAIRPFSKSLSEPVCSVMNPGIPRRTQ